LKTGDVVAIKEKSKRAKLFSDIEGRLKKAKVPGWINMDAKKLAGKVLHLPKKEDLTTNVNPQMIVEFYSR